VVAPGSFAQSDDDGPLCTAGCMQLSIIFA
jgi:hypothetical protein